jgi:hypothetical protein
MIRWNNCKQNNYISINYNTLELFHDKISIYLFILYYLQKYILFCIISICVCICVTIFWQINKYIKNTKNNSKFYCYCYNRLSITYSTSCNCFSTKHRTAYNSNIISVYLCTSPSNKQTITQIYMSNKETNIVI